MHGCALWPICSTSKDALQESSVLHVNRLVIPEAHFVARDYLGCAVLAAGQCGRVRRQSCKQHIGEETHHKQQYDCKQQPTNDEINHCLTRPNGWPAAYTADHPSETLRLFGESDGAYVVPAELVPLVGVTNA